MEQTLAPSTSGTASPFYNVYNENQKINTLLRPEEERVRGHR